MTVENHNDIISSLFQGGQNICLLDGGLATELEVRGMNLNDPLWSAKCLIENPELIRDVHRDYFQHGAQIAITATYQVPQL